MSLVLGNISVESCSNNFLNIDGKDQATVFDAKFLETSSALKHNVDELLVGTTKQMLLRKEPEGGKKDIGNWPQATVK